MKKKILSLLLVLSLFSTAVPTSAQTIDPVHEENYEYALNGDEALETDPMDGIMTASPWAREGITAAIDKGFVPSEIQGSYTDVITRLEFCRMAVKWLEYKTAKGVDTILSEQGKSRDPNAFTDTDDPDILAAYALGITNGTGDNQFTPNGGFDREQAAAMIRNACRATGMDVSNISPAGYKDIITASSWAVGSINYCRNSGVMLGTGNDNFSPKQAFTREQSILVFDRINPREQPDDTEKVSVNSLSVAGKKIPILMYHAIADVPTTKWTGLFVRPSELRAQMKYLADNGFQTITFEDLDNIGAFSKPVMLTFDDGYRDNYEILFPLLKEFNMKATIFVITDTVWSSNYISQEQIREMSDSGFVSIQSHTVSHASLPSLGGAALNKELSESKRILEELTGRPVIAHAYPCGDNNGNVRAAASQYYDYAVTTNSGKFVCGSNTLTMNRVGIGRGLGIRAFAALVN